MAGKVTIYWGKPINIDRKVSYNRPDMVVIDFAIPMDHYVKENMEEKLISTWIWQLRLEDNLW